MRDALVGERVSQGGARGKSPRSESRHRRAWGRESALVQSRLVGAGLGGKGRLLGRSPITTRQRSNWLHMRASNREKHDTVRERGLFYNARV